MKPVHQQTDAQLAYAIQDLREVIGIWDRPDVASLNPKLPRYLDEFHACLAERHRRRVGQRVVVELSAADAARLGLVV